jgi:hypothetical protein
MVAEFRYTVIDGVGKNVAKTCQPLVHLVTLYCLMPRMC